MPQHRETGAVCVLKEATSSVCWPVRVGLCTIYGSTARTTTARYARGTTVKHSTRHINYVSKKKK